jgi:hypothetical protein
MLERNQILSLLKAVVKSTPNTSTTFSFNGETKSYSYEALNETLRQEMNELAGTYSLYRDNKNMLFSLMEETYDEVLPKKVIDAYGAFAEVKTVGQGDKPIFTQKTGKQRAKKFVTSVGLAGIYEVFKLGSKAIEVSMEAVGGAAQIGLEEFLDGRVDFAELTTIIMEGLDDAVYARIASALTAAMDNMLEVNKVEDAGFIEKDFDGLIAISSAYGIPTIYCTYEFAAEMVPADKWISDEMRNNRWANGYFTSYKGHRVIILPQSFVDETNTEKVINPAYAWIIPGDEKPVKIAFEGQTIVDEFTNYDRSREIQVYKKLGVSAIVSNGVTVYHNTALDANA